MAYKINILLYNLKNIKNWLASSAWKNNIILEKYNLL